MKPSSAYSPATHSSADVSLDLSAAPVSPAISVPALTESVDKESAAALTSDRPSAKNPPPNRDHPHSQGNHPGADHPLDNAHIHSEASRKRIINRLSRMEGHLRGIKTMVQDDRACPDVLIQIAAVRGGLDRVARIILDEHLSECITRAVDEGNIEAEVAALKAALDRFI